jgi:hypothetical protein
VFVQVLKLERIPRDETSNGTSDNYLSLRALQKQYSLAIALQIIPGDGLLLPHP